MPLAPGGISQADSDTGRPCDPFLTMLAADSPTTAVAVGGCYSGPARHAVLATGILVPSK